MGMFDYVHYPTKCKSCGETITEFQSKDGECILAHLKPTDVEQFYGNCPKCGEWHSFDVHVLVTPSRMPNY